MIAFFFVLPQMREIVRNFLDKGNEIGSHTIYHRDLCNEPGPKWWNFTTEARVPVTSHPTQHNTTLPPTCNHFPPSRSHFPFNPPLSQIDDFDEILRDGLGVWPEEVGTFSYPFGGVCDAVRKVGRNRFVVRSQSPPATTETRHGPSGFICLPAGGGGFSPVHFLAQGRLWM